MKKYENQTHHNLASAKLDRTLQIFPVVSFSTRTIHMSFGIVTIHIEGTLVAPNRPLPIPTRPSSIDLCKTITTLRIFLRYERFLLSNPTMQTGLLQSITDCLLIKRRTSEFLNDFTNFTKKEMREISSNHVYFKQILIENWYSSNQAASILK